MSAKKIYTIEGEIGAGKTELAKALAAELISQGKSVCLVLEPVEQWKEAGVLKEFYANPSRFAYAFQTFVFATRILAIHKGMHQMPDADIYLFERSPISDMIFMALQEVTPIERLMYKSWCDSWLSLHPVDFSQAMAIYLRTSTSTCMARVEARGRDGEVKTDAAGVTQEYQQRLKQAHEAFFMKTHEGVFPDLPSNPMGGVIVVGEKIADRDFRSGAPGAKKVLCAIIRGMGLN